MTAIATINGRPIADLHPINNGGCDLITGHAIPPIYLATDINGRLHYAPADTIQVAITPEETP